MVWGRSFLHTRWTWLCQSTLFLVVASQDPSTSLDELARKGQMVPMVGSEQKVVFAELALTLEKGQGVPMPANSGQQFSHKDQRVWACVSWNENLPFKGNRHNGGL